ncbi:hypothetical protein B1T45_09550 [Mycobacterium kansasii]|nr:hypothetical protein B1T43_09210 [Mycobacterium kansasii]ARG61494.1 hypothetical protein B1T45_09550 [Mycobacterium kansasii]ARG69132.1 hypothetical protein B1T47_08910 [Mycobacterium kansasii]ARG76250.1 hypothetical protein B1T51_19235 [Mycobacterium kansasii]ARG81777.1 hypothetical protein B1T52_19600 [Mycobacterium kansasii]
MSRWWKFREALREISGLGTPEAGTDAAPLVHNTRIAASDAKPDRNQPEPTGTNRNQPEPTGTNRNSVPGPAGWTNRDQF